VASDVMGEQWFFPRQRGRGSINCSGYGLSRQRREMEALAEEWRHRGLPPDHPDARLAGVHVAGLWRRDFKGDRHPADLKAAGVTE